MRAYIDVIRPESQCDLLNLPGFVLKEFSEAAALLLLRRLVRETHKVSTYPV